MTTGRPKSPPASLSRPVPSLPLLVGLVVILTLAASACAGGTDDVVVERGTFHPDGFDGVIAEPPDDLYDPVAAGESIPPGFRQLLERDDIFPVYQPRFVATGNAGWEPEELIIGVEIDGEARAYPVSFLNRREIVVDLHRGIPTFVTW